MRRDTDDTTAWTILIEDGCYPIIRVVKVILITDKNKISLTRKNINYMSNDRLSVNLDQRLRLCIPRAAETFAESRHRNDNLHRTPIL